MDSSIQTLLEEEQKREDARMQVTLKHLAAGVIFVDRKAVYIDDTVEIGPGTTIWPGAILEGKTVIGKDCVIGPGCRIRDSIIEDGADLQNAVVLESSVGKGTKVGPFAYLRPGSKVGANAKVGDFVEIKNSTLGDGSKASHLTYIGDSDVGENVNLGCGVVFVNYDGSKKYRSTVGDGAFVGCNVNLVSPVNVGEGAYVAAGTTVTEDVPPGALCVGRQKQKHVDGWVEKRGILKKKK
ncbi:MAG: UDP-N-acetylglucosamine diphosphorylase [Clostridiales bacterium]|nr:UDP-N-acetylglucosamine diphosphorylase [Clostridiales bacterium]